MIKFVLTTLIGLYTLWALFVLFVLKPLTAWLVRKNEKDRQDQAKYQAMFTGVMDYLHKLPPDQYARIRKNPHEFFEEQEKKRQAESSD